MVNPLSDLPCGMKQGPHVALGELEVGVKVRPPLGAGPVRYTSPVALFPPPIGEPKTLKLPGTGGTISTVATAPVDPVV